MAAFLKTALLSLNLGNVQHSVALKLCRMKLHRLAANAVSSWVDTVWLFWLLQTAPSPRSSVFHRSPIRKVVAVLSPPSPGGFFSRAIRVMSHVIVPLGYGQGQKQLENLHRPKHLGNSPHPRWRGWKEGGYYLDLEVQ